MSTFGQPDENVVDDQFAEGDARDSPALRDAHVHDAPEEPDADKSAQELILEDSLERTEHPEETGAASSQTIPEII